MKKQLPIYVVLIVGLFAMAIKFIDFGTWGKTATTELDTWIQTSYIFAFLYGPINLIRLHAVNTQKRRPRWIYSAIFLALIAITTPLFLAMGLKHPFNAFIIDNITNQIDSAIYAMLGFYVCSAAYRSFKLKNVEATILLIAAIILMLGQAPIGERIIPGITKVSQWVLDVPNSAGMRGIRIGASIGAFAASIRVILGLERSWTGSGH